MKSVYIHVPFCNNICVYCDFSKVYYNSSLVMNYLQSLEKELIKYYQGEEIYTLYIGGGTPSCLSVSELEYLFKIVKSLDLSKLQEFTIECNIEDINEQKLKLFKESGVNRLSIGIQTFNKKILDYLGRNSNTDIKGNLILAKKYFDNINVDLIYAIDNQSINDLEKDIDNVIDLNIPHISTYSLIIEEHTKLHIDNTSFIDEDIDRGMYDYITRKLNEKEYIHYEISNFSKENYQSKHNLVYWNNEEYYGFGLGSHGFINNVRYENTRSINNYIGKNYHLDEHVLTKQEMMENELILGFRKVCGINKNTFFNKYNIDIKEAFNIEKHIKSNQIIEDNEMLYINPDFLYTMNNIIIDFIGDKNERENN